MKRDELVAAIRAAPDDDELRGVFTDHLLEIGDPWGELIVHDRRELRIEVERRLLAPIENCAIATWRLGFIERLDVRYDVDPEDLANTLAHPELAALRDIDLRGSVPYIRDRGLSALSELVGDRPLRWLGVDATTDVRRDFPHLRGLAVPWHAGANLDGLVDVELDIDRRDDIAPALAAIPRDVERIVLGLPRDATGNDLLPLHDFPALRHLGVMRDDPSRRDTLFDAIRELFPRLQTLGFVPGPEERRWVPLHTDEIEHVKLFTRLGGNAWTSHLDDLGHLLLEVGRAQEALALFDRLLVPRDTAHAWNDLGLALFETHRLDEALAAHDRATELDPTQYWSQVGRGQVLAGLHRFDEAAPAWAHATEISDDGWTWGERGATLEELGRDDEAMAAYDRALARSAAYDSAALRRAELLADLGDPRAAAALEAMVPRWPEMASSLALRLGRLVRARGDDPRPAFECALALTSFPDSALANLVDVALEHGDDALVFAQTASLRGWVLLEYGRADDAAATFASEERRDYHGHALALGRADVLADAGRDDVCVANRALTRLVHAAITGDAGELSPLLDTPFDPHALYAALAFGPERDHSCRRYDCARRCALAALAAALLAGRPLQPRLDALARGRTACLTRQWEIRGALRFANVDVAPIAAALRRVEVG